LAADLFPPFPKSGLGRKYESVVMRPALPTKGTAVRHHEVGSAATRYNLLLVPDMPGVEGGGDVLFKRPAGTALPLLTGAKQDRIDFRVPSHKSGRKVVAAREQRQ